MIIQSAFSEYYHVIKVSNKVNDIVLAPLASKEIDIFSVICYMMKNQKNKIITITYNDFKSISGFRHISNQKFSEFMKRLYKKIRMFEYYYSQNGIWECGWIFIRFKIIEEEQKVEIQVNDSFLSFFNDYDNVQYTIYYQEIMNSLRSKYSKIYLKFFTQRKSEGIAEQNYNDFLIYNNATKMRSDVIDQKIIKPIVSELAQYFKNLKCEKIKDGLGQKIKGLKWTWDSTEGLAPEFDIERFKQFFDEIGVDMNYSIQLAIVKLLKTMSEQAVLRYLEQNWNTVINFPKDYVKNPQGFFCNAVIKNKILQPINDEKKKNKDKIIHKASHNNKNLVQKNETFPEDPAWKDFNCLPVDEQEFFWGKGAELFNKNMAGSLIVEKYNICTIPYVIDLFKKSQGIKDGNNN